MTEGQVVKIPVGVEVECRPGRTRWQATVWQPVAITPPQEALADWTLLHDSEGRQRFHAGNRPLEFHPSAATLYKENLEARQPSVWVVLRPGRGTDQGVGPRTDLMLHLVTADPTVAHAYVDVGPDLVEALSMPPGIAATLAAFVQRHYTPRTVWKRQRDRVDPEAMAARREGGV
ncbi:DUF3305 domain-containing protein [Halodurantibacterium flavum]|uniref:DUF3305 domain-containing protein n=1 Tax=Halodurantibacterium flavum TaxID=1382802 RepID=A0ABW4S7G4_9RHOB